MFSPKRLVESVKTFLNEVPSTSYSDASVHSRNGESREKSRDSYRNSASSRVARWLENYLSWHYFNFSDLFALPVYNCT
uniref:Integrase catalytic domain-containing protein n=1 Tax=Steinernema glaseri TaxID=37863 RepID=A0A1I7YFA6_9BILA